MSVSSFGALKNRRRKVFNPLEAPQSFDDIFSHKRDWSFDADIGLQILNAFERIVTRPQGFATKKGSWKHIDWRTIPEHIKVKEEEIIQLAEDLRKLGLSEEEIADRIIDEVVYPSLPPEVKEASVSVPEPEPTSEQELRIPEESRIPLESTISIGPAEPPPTRFSIKGSIRNRLERAKQKLTNKREQLEHARTVLVGVAERIPEKIEKMLDQMPEMTTAPML